MFRFPLLHAYKIRNKIGRGHCLKMSWLHVIWTIGLYMLVQLDARVLQNALQNNFHVPEWKFYLVYVGYANTPNFIAPYHNVRCHLQEQGWSNQRPQTPQELFNLRHAQLRNHVERVIGVVKMRFQILKCASQHPIDSQADIVLSCCALHNFINSHQGSEQWIEQSSLCVGETEIVDVPGEIHII